MQEGTPSRTAYRVALRRAAHQIFDRPLVFEDPLAVRILGNASRDLRAPDRASSKSLRAYLVARSAFAEDALRHAVARGVTQYLLLGAGLDTFAYRNPYPELTVFEVDHPATQRWKQSLLRQGGMTIPRSCLHVSIDFEMETLPERLQAFGFDPMAATQISWLGVVPYLTRDSFDVTLQFLSTLAHGSGVVLDYALPRELLNGREQLEFDSLAERVRLAGEPFQLFWPPEQMENRLGWAGFRVIDHLCKAGINQRFFAERGDGLEVLGSGGRLVGAVRS